MTDERSTTNHAGIKKNVLFALPYALGIGVGVTMEVQSILHHVWLVVVTFILSVAVLSLLDAIHSKVKRDD